MAKKFHEPIRTCVACRAKEAQHKLTRLQCIDGNLTAFNGSGRSFYLCKNCLEDEKKLTKALMRQCRTSQKDKLMNKLKEIITDDRKS
jgi:predicted RNA-binding protein YlxR (DUF448 family)